MTVEYDISLDGHGFMLQEGGSSVATINNPPGLRTAGGNILREFGQWTEEEWADFSNGAGQSSPSNNGYLHSSGDTLHGGWRLEQAIHKLEVEALTTSSIAPSHGAHFVEYGGYVLMGIDNKLRIMRRSTSNYNPGILATVNFTVYDQTATVGGMWAYSWYDTTSIQPYFPFEGGTLTGTLPGGDLHWVGMTIKANFRITSMAIFGEYLAVTLCNDESASLQNFWFADPVTPNTNGAVGLYLVRLAPLLTTTPSGTITLEVGSTGYFAYDTKRDAYRDDWYEDEPLHIETMGRYRPLYEAVGCKVINGLLFFWSGNGLFYTNGQYHPDFGLSLDPALPDTANKILASSVRHWAWYGTQLESASERTDWLWERNDVVLTPLAERITGVVSLQGGTVSETVIYVSTTHRLYAFLPGDEFSYIAAWGSYHWWNGIGCIAHAGDGYFPVGSGLVRVTPTGQIINMGLDRMPVYPHRAFIRHGCALASVRGVLVAMSEAYIPTDSNAQSGFTSAAQQNIVTRVWAYETQGWHPLASRHPTDSSDDTDDIFGIDMGWMQQAQGIFYSTAANTLWFATSNDRPEVPDIAANKGPVNVYCMTFAEKIGSSLEQVTFRPRYAPMGWLVLPPFDAGAIVLEKDWNSIAVYGSCFHNGSSIECFYRLSKGIAAAIGCENTQQTFGTNDDGVHYAQPGWTSLGLKTFTAGTALDGGLVEWAWPIPRTLSSNAIELKFQVKRGSDVLLTPHIRAIRLQHHDAIKDYFRFNVTVNLPSDCLYDRCRVLVPGYDFYDYDAYVRAAVCKVVPLAFTDVDGQQYYVRVETASRRTANPGRDPTSGQRTFDVVWSLILTQLDPDSLCDIPAPT